MHSTDDQIPSGVSRGLPARLEQILRLPSENYIVPKFVLREAAETITRLETKLAHEERAHLQTIDERDTAEGAADSLAYAIGSEDEIGEHSNLNNPWANALEKVEALRARAEDAEARVAQLERELEALRRRRHAREPAELLVIISEQKSQIDDMRRLIGYQARQLERVKREWHIHNL